MLFIGRILSRYRIYKYKRSFNTMTPNQKLIEFYKRATIESLDIKITTIYPNIKAFVLELEKFKSLVDNEEVIKYEQKYRNHTSPVEEYRRIYLDGKGIDYLKNIKDFCCDYGDTLLNHKGDDHRVVIISARIISELHRLVSFIGVKDEELLQSIGIIEQGRVRPELIRGATTLPVLGSS